jgi:predicted Mrr-cat superfamily restriction endonuclease
LTKSKVKKLWNECKEVTLPKKRGKLFELFVQKLFSLEFGLHIVKPNLKTVNEEIDILIQNKITSPHWLKYGSPYIFVECKNHEKPIESKDIREFVTKIRNHPGHCTLGFFFSTSGFTKGCFQELVGIRNLPISLALIDGSMIDNFFKNRLELKEFLEEQIPNSIK